LAVKSATNIAFVGFLGLCIVAVLAGIWYVGGVLLSEPKGAADEHKAVNDVENRIQSQEWFWETYEEIQASDDNLQQAAVDKADNPGDDFYATNYTGLKAYCTGLVGEYNAEVKKVTSRDYLDEQLPTRIDDTDPATDCQEDEPVA
jgi:hypothetical protein